MPYGAAADAVLLLHALFIAFVVAGGLLVWRWPRAAWLHLPAVAWGALVELMAWPCPLTPLENALRRAAGEPAITTGFIDHWLTVLIYPPGLTPRTQLWLGVGVVAANFFVYGTLLAKRRPPGARD